jgi:hypothetical protein
VVDFVCEGELTIEIGFHEVRVRRRTPVAIKEGLKAKRSRSKSVKADRYSPSENIKVISELFAVVSLVHSILLTMS